MERSFMGFGKKAWELTKNVVKKTGNAVEVVGKTSNYLAKKDTPLRNALNPEKLLNPLAVTGGILDAARKVKRAREILKQ